MTFTDPPPRPATRVSTAARYGRDLFERAASTFLQAFLAILTTGGVFAVGGLWDVSAWQAAAAAGVAAVYSLLKSVLAKAVGRSDSASLDPAV